MHFILDYEDPHPHPHPPMSKVSHPHPRMCEVTSVTSLNETRQFCNSKNCFLDFTNFFDEISKIPVHSEYEFWHPQQLSAQRIMSRLDHSVTLSCPITPYNSKSYQWVLTINLAFESVTPAPTGPWSQFRPSPPPQEGGGTLSSILPFFLYGHEMNKGKWVKNYQGF